MHGAEASSLPDRTHPPMSGASVESLPVMSPDDRSLVAFTNRQVDGAGRSWHQRDHRWLVAFPDDVERAVTPLEAQVLDIGPARLGDAQSMSPSSTASAAWA